MAGTDRKKADDLTHLLKALEEKPYAFGFFSTLRRLECLYKERPRLGTSKRAADEPIRLSHEPALTFETSSLTAFKTATNGKAHRMSVRLLGLLGPNGPLPLHFTEYVKQRQRDYSDETFVHFLDIFHHRMLSLFYRAWANNEPTVSYDRPDADPFGNYVGSLAGLGMASLGNRDAIADQTKRYYCGRLASQTRCADSLQAILTDYFNVETRVEEFVGEWLELPHQHICRLGLDSASGQLGKSIVIGEKAWSCQHKFRVHLGPLSFNTYQRFLPAGDRIRRLVLLVRNYIGDELAWDLRLILECEQVPPTRLDGNCRLGWTTWMGERPTDRDAHDLVLDAFDWVHRNKDN